MSPRFGWTKKPASIMYFMQSGYAGGMTPLLDREGKPVVSPILNGSLPMRDKLKSRESNELSLKFAGFLPLFACRGRFRLTISNLFGIIKKHSPLSPKQYRVI